MDCSIVRLFDFWMEDGRWEREAGRWEKFQKRNSKFHPEGSGLNSKN
ncbi:MAG: hypothetical protein ACK4FS_04355 [Flavobacterium sp.]